MKERKCKILIFHEFKSIEEKKREAFVMKGTILTQMHRKGKGWIKLQICLKHCVTKITIIIGSFTFCENERHFCFEMICIKTEEIFDFSAFKAFSSRDIVIRAFIQQKYISN